MKYRLQLVPQGSIPRDLGIKLKLTPQTVGAPPQGGGCQDIFAGYFVAGLPSDLILQNTYDWPAGTWTAVITGFAFTCAPATYTWTVVTANFVVGSPPTWVDSIDSNGRPVLTVSSSIDDMLDGGTQVMDIVLNINGKPVETHVTLKPQVINYYNEFFGFTDDGQWAWSFTGALSPDPSIAGAAGDLFASTGINTTPDGTTATFVFKAYNAPSSVSNFSFSNLMGSGAAVTVDTSGSFWGAETIAFTIVFTPSMGDCTGSITWTSVDSVLAGVFAPGAGGSYSITFT